MPESCGEVTDFDYGGGIYLELFILGLVFYSLMILTEEYLMDLIEMVIDKYNISQQMAGIIIAIGSIVPEFTANMYASLSDSDDL
jgi:Ca2+/H+ antiporter